MARKPGGSTITVIEDLVDSLTESHQEEIDNGHGRDNPRTCLYCRSIADGKAVLRRLYTEAEEQERRQGARFWSKGGPR
jgi:hypothetical protein